MPELLSQLTGPEWTKDGPQSPAQQFLAKYVATVDSYGFMQGSGSRFYAKDAVFHNQNNAQYRGPEQMWAWMKKIFGQFERLRHDFLNAWEIKQNDGSSIVLAQMVRNIWIPGNKTDKPEVSAPTFFACRIAAADDENAFGGLQFKEVWCKNLDCRLKEAPPGGLSNSLV